jgi:fimbrial chaperone protein
MYLKQLMAGILVCLNLIGANAVKASDLQVSPVRLTLSPKQNIVAFHVNNLSKNTVLLQSKVKQWIQDNGKDIYHDQDNIFISPPIVTIPAGESQIFRVALRKALTSETEQSYRVFLQEVVTPKQGAGLSFSVRIGVPLFIHPFKSSERKVTWKIKRDKQAVLITATNPNNHHVQITRLKLLDKEKKQILVDKSVFHYLLPGQSFTWIFDKDEKANQFLKTLDDTILEAMSDFGAMSQKLKSA